MTQTTKALISLRRQSVGLPMPKQGIRSLTSMSDAGFYHGELRTNSHRLNASSLTRAAIESLATIRAYIGKHNPVAASRIAVQLVAACDRLEHLPERGRPGLLLGTRELVVLWPYVIVYRITGEVVEIVNIWHGAQDR